MIEGGEKVKNRLKKAKGSTKNEVEQALTKGALMVERDYKLNVNQVGLVDTGRWINSITHQQNNYGTDNPSVQIGATVIDPPYPLYHEFGTSKFPAKPTLTPAYLGNRSKILKELAQAFKRGVGL